MYYMLDEHRMSLGTVRLERLVKTILVVVIIWL